MTDEFTIKVNDDKTVAPLDAVSATVNAVRTKFREGKGSTDHPNYMKQKTVLANVKASNELGVFSISIPDENIMVTIRFDETVEIIAAALNAAKKMEGKATDEKAN